MKSKIKYILSICLVLISLFSCCINAFALDTSVDFGNAEEYIFNPTDKDLFSDFKGIMPGDTKEQIVALKNTGSSYIASIYMKARVDDASKDFLQYITLDIYSSDTKGGKDNLISSSKASEEGNLSDWVKLCSLKPDETKYITVVLSVDSKMNNSQALKKGIIHWVFREEDESITTETDTSVSVTSAPDTIKPAGSVTKVTGRSVTKSVTATTKDSKNITVVVSKKGESTTKIATLPFTGSYKTAPVAYAVAILIATTLFIFSVLGKNKKKDDDKDNEN